MLKRFSMLGAAALLFAASSVANATVIVGATSTTDTGQGLEFLHLGNSPTSLTFAGAQAGINFGGFSWVLATVTQFTTLISNATGLSVPAWNGGNLTDYNMSASQADSMMSALLGGTGDNRQGGWTWLDGENIAGNDRAQVFAHNDANEDFHLRAGTVDPTTHALFVRAANVPAPGTLLLIGAGLIGLAVSRTRRA